MTDGKTTAVAINKETIEKYKELSNSQPFNLDALAIAANRIILEYFNIKQDVNEPNWQAIDKAITILNQALSADKDAVSKLINYRVDCNQDMANHESIQAGILNGKTQVGMMGIINGLFGADKDGCGFICYEHDNGEIVEFKRMPARD